MQRAIGLMAVAAICWSAAGCRPTRAAESDYITVGIAVSPTNLDPRIGSDEASQRAHELLYGKLLRLDERLRVVPDIATGWQTPNDRTYILNPEVDWLIDLASVSLDDDVRRKLYGRVQQLVAEEVPYLALWYKTNVAVSQPDIRGVQLSPVADFGFLKGVQRVPLAATTETSE
ncbi:MAG: hypothetical protein HYX76_10290 [Acidobacteria bacterium]|nr:hypothetical protein [Acidobacteriota bacterium]